MTSNQTQGKGQRGNSWESESGVNLCFSIYTEPHELASNCQFRINFYVCLALHRFLAKHLNDPENLKVKWPNDIYYRDHKLCGILVENMVRSSVLSYSIIGIGLNVNQIQFETPNATSIALINEDTYELEEVLGLLLKELNLTFEQYQVGDLDDLHQDYLDVLLGHNSVRDYVDVASREYFRAKIIDVTPQGKLCVELDQHQFRQYDLKEIKFIFDS